MKRIRPAFQLSSPFTILLFSLLLIAGLSACNGGGDDKGNDANQYTDTHDKGRIKIVVDETLKPFAQAEVIAYEQQYPKTKFDVAYLPERKAFKQFMAEDDTVRLIIGTRELRENEKQAFKPKKFKPRTYEMAYDAVAFIVHKDNVDQDLTMEEVKRILSGEVTKWPELNEPGALDEEIRIVFDDANSSTRRVLSDSLMAPDNMAKSRLYAAGSTPEVIKYVAENKNALGVVGYNWISDTSQEDIADAYKDVIMVSLPSTQNVQKYVYLPDYPIQFLRNNIYPLRRSVYVHVGEPHRGLGTGLANFIGGQQGLRIILQSGLYPMGRLARKVQFEEVPAKQMPDNVEGGL